MAAHSCRLLAGAAIAFALALPQASPADWVSQADPGTLAIAPQFEGQEIPGAFRRFEVVLAGRPGVDDHATLTVRVDIASASFDDGDVEEEVAGPDWFDFARFPEAEFRSDRIEPDADRGFRATGRLTIKGRTTALTLPFRFRVEGATARIAGAVVLDRRSFDIGSGDWATDDSIGFEVPVRYDARLRRADVHRVFYV